MDDQKENYLDPEPLKQQLTVFTDDVEDSYCPQEKRYITRLNATWFLRRTERMSQGNNKNRDLLYIDEPRRKNCNHDIDRSQKVYIGPQN